MPTLSFRFDCGRGPIGRIIEYAGAGPYSHVDVIWPDGRWYGARSDRVGGAEPGVQFREAGYTGNPGVVLELDATDDQESRFYSALLSQEHKPYDKIGILGFVTDRDWRANDSWFCSEIGIWALEECGRCPRLLTPVNKIMPVTLFTVLSALGAK